MGTPCDGDRGAPLFPPGPPPVETVMAYPLFRLAAPPFGLFWGRGGDGTPGQGQNDGGNSRGWPQKRGKRGRKNLSKKGLGPGGGPPFLPPNSPSPRAPPETPPGSPGDPRSPRGPAAQTPLPRSLPLFPPGSAGGLVSSPCGGVRGRGPLGRGAPGGPLPANRWKWVFSLFSFPFVGFLVLFWGVGLISCPYMVLKRFCLLLSFLIVKNFLNFPF